MTDDETRLLSRLDGTLVHGGLGDEDREVFEEAFRFALAGVRITYEIEPLTAVVREWWEAAGGDPDVADADRYRSDRDATINRRPQPPQQDPTRWVDRTGPAVYAALSRDDRVRFELDLAGAAEFAERTFDHRRLLKVVHDWWIPACRNANPEHVEKDLETVRRIEAGDPRVFADPDKEE